MRKETKLTSLCLALAVGVASIATSYSVHAQAAAATISDTPVTGGYDYIITLHNTDSTLLNSFWYGWTQGGNNLPSIPSTPGNSLGWGNSVVGNSIEWVNSTGTPLAPGGFGVFTFFSTSTPTAMTTPPHGESVAYVNGIDFSQGAPGDSTGIFSPSPVPEPSPMALIGAGMMGLMAIGWRRLRMTQQLRCGRNQ